MRRIGAAWLLLPALAAVVVVAGLIPSAADSACCYFSAKDKDILQPAQKVFLTWDPTEKVESFTVQPKFEGNASDFGMVIPTPVGCHNTIMHQSGANANDRITCVKQW